jgi:hypothetical protein
MAPGFRGATNQRTVGDLLECGIVSCEGNVLLQTGDPLLRKLDSEMPSGFLESASGKGCHCVSRFRLFHSDLSLCFIASLLRSSFPLWLLLPRFLVSFSLLYFLFLVCRLEINGAKSIEAKNGCDITSLAHGSNCLFDIVTVQRTVDFLCGTKDIV